MSDYSKWPIPKFSFWVDIGGSDGRVAFQGMDGLGASVAKMEFRDGNSSKFYKQSRPTLTSFDPCTLKKGMFSGDISLYSWFSNVSSGTWFSDMRTVTITLCEMTDGGKQTDLFCWTLEKAYVTKFTPSNMDAEADSEPAIEEVELSYQSFSISSGGILDAIIDAIF
jgi:phage tail-like protein